MDRELFEALIQDATREIVGRYSDYFSSHVVNVRPLCDLAHDYARQVQFSSYSCTQLIGALTQGLRALENQGAAIRQGSAQQDPVSGILIDSIMDGYLAATGNLPLRPGPIRLSDTANSLLEAYSYKTTSNGVRYVISTGEGQALLIISSTGVPINVWFDVLRDRTINRRCLMVQSRSGPLEGGTPHRAGLWEDVAAVKDVLETEELLHVSVLGWCDGARVAIEVARSTPDRIESLTLLAPTFHGAVNSKTYPSPFEDSLPEICRMFGNDARRNLFLLDSIAQYAVGEPAPQQDPTNQGTAFLRLPPLAYGSALLMPLSTIEYFKNYVDRLSNDESYDIHTALTDVRCSILLLTGTHDAAINSRAARDLLSLRGRDVLHTTILGAGHHIHLLQYGYFRYVLNCFLSRSTPTQTARLRVENLSKTDESNFARS